MTRAARDGVTTSDVIRAALHHYTKEDPTMSEQSDPDLLDAYRKQLAHMDPGVVYLAWQGQAGHHSRRLAGRVQARRQSPGCLTSPATTTRTDRETVETRTRVTVSAVVRDALEAYVKEDGMNEDDVGATMVYPCSSDGCDRPATDALIFRGMPGHVHDCAEHAAVVREWCDVSDSASMPCPWGHGDGSSWREQPYYLGHGCKCPHMWRPSTGRLDGIDMGPGWSRVTDNPDCPLHGINA